jgi:glycerol-3-phosphate dehydrogenase
MTVDILREEGASMEEKEGFNPYRKKPVVMSKLRVDEKKEIIEKNPQYGKIVCRCEQVTEGEVLDAIHATLPALNIDAIKRRTRAGMGRCQGGFCLPHIASILARETGMPLEAITKSGEGSHLFAGKTKCVLEGKSC